jgi:hypothetical protein
VPERETNYIHLVKRLKMLGDVRDSAMCLFGMYRKNAISLRFHSRLQNWGSMFVNIT